MGNICRSPTAEGVFLHLVKQAGRQDEFHVDSAGTHGYHVGHSPDSRMQAAARERGYSLDSRARRVQADDFERFDFIVAMDDANFSDLDSIDPGARANLVRMCDYCESRDENEVPDPYYGGEAGFFQVIDILEDACSGLLKKL